MQQLTAELKQSHFNQVCASDGALCVIETKRAYALADLGHIQKKSLMMIEGAVLILSV